MSNISLKKHIINSLSNLSSDKPDGLIGSNKLVFVTAAGIISGYPYEINSKSDPSTFQGLMSILPVFHLTDTKKAFKASKISMRMTASYYLKMLQLITGLQLFLHQVFSCFLIK